MDVLLYAANFALLMAINVTIAWACSRILPLRNPRTIYVVQIVSCVLGIWVTWLDITPINPSASRSSTVWSPTSAGTRLGRSASSARSCCSCSFSCASR